jgi:hypothetical protein
MADRTSTLTDYVALIAPHPVLRTTDALWSAESTYTEANARPGLPDDPDKTSEFVLEATGSQTSGGQLRLQGHTPGMPGNVEAGVVWRNNATTPEIWRGRDVPSVITAHEFVVYASGTVAVDNPTAIALPDDTVVVAHEHTVASIDSVAVSVRATSGTWSTTTSILSSATGWGTYTPFPCPLRLPSGRLLLFCWVQQGSDDVAQIRMFYSDDTGSTWNLGSRYCLKSGIDTSSTPGSGNAGYDLRRIRAVYLDGDISLVCHLSQHDTSQTSRDVLAQFVSSDLGATFTQVGSTWSGSSSTEQGGIPELFTLDGLIYLYYHRNSGLALEGPTWRVIGNANDPFINATATTVSITGGLDAGFFEYTNSGASNIQITDGDLAILPDRTGSLYLYLRRANVNTLALKNDVTCLVSHDKGATWERLGTSDGVDGHLWDNSTDDSHPKNMTAATCQGRIALISLHASNNTTADNSLGVMYLGGSSTVTMPNLDGALTDTNQATWQETWLPYDVPSDMTNWTGTGSGTDSITSGELVISTTGAQNRYYDLTPTSTASQGLIVRFRVTRDSGGGTSFDYIAVRLQVADGTTDHDVSIRLYDSSGNTAIKVVDNNNSGSTVGSDQTGTGDEIEVIAALSKNSTGTQGRFALWWRNPSTGSDREWTAGQSSTTITNASTPTTGNLVRWGHITIQAGDSDWHEFMVSYGSHTGLHLAGGQDNPDDLYPLRVGTSRVYLDDGVFIRGKDGPLFIGEDFEIDAVADHALARVWPSVKRSPREGWRSTDDSTQVEIALALDASFLGTDAGLLGSDVFAVMLVGCNFKTWQIQGYTGGAWSTLATVDNSTHYQGLSFIREGSTVGPDINYNSTDTPYIGRNRLVGGTIDLDGTPRKITANTGGVWTDADVKRPILHIADADAADPTQGDIDTTPSSDAADIWAPNVCAVVQLKGTVYSGFRIVIPVQTTADGDFRIGSMMAGPLVAMGRRPARGTAEEVQTTTELREAEDRTQRARNRGPSRRIVEIPLTDLYPLGSIYQNTPSGWDYWKGTTASGAVALAMQQDTPPMIQGLLDQCAGALHPVGYLPYVQVSDGSSDVQVINQSSLLYYGHLSDGVRFERVAGEPWEELVVRGGGVLALTELV